MGTEPHSEHFICLATDGRNVCLSWEEQLNLGQHPQVYVAKDEGERLCVRDRLLLRTQPATNNVPDYAVKKNIDHLLEVRQKLFTIFLSRPSVPKPPDYKRNENEISVALCISD